MPDSGTSAGRLRPNELEAVYAISRVVSMAEDIDTAMDQITNLTRSVFIFDSAVLYRVQADGPEPLEPLFARVVGRGRSAPADLVWGELAAKQALEAGDVVIQEEGVKGGDRLDEHYYLALPMIAGGRKTGALVFIRFGGPSYTEEQVGLASFIATHVTQLFERSLLVARVANLEAERRLARLQDDFIAMVSHELLTPLGFIKGYSTTLLRKDAQWDEATLREFLTIIDEESDRLSELIENLLDSSRLQSGTLRMELKRVRLSDVLGDVMGRMQSRYNNLEMSVDLEEADVWVRVDGKRLGQVLENLTANAAKYAPGCCLRLWVTNAAEGLEIHLADDGPGIPTEHLPNLFKRFYRVPERSAGVRGTGLGLFICEQIVKSHQGRIRVESHPGQGTTFSLWLPRAADESGTDEEKHA